MATENKPKAKPEPWYPFNSGPPKDKVAGEASADGVKQKPEPWYPFEAGRPKAQPEANHSSTGAKTSAAPASAAPTLSPADFKKDAQPSPMDKLVRSEPQNLFDRLKPEPNVIRPSWEQAKPLMEREKVALVSAAKSQGGGERQGSAGADSAKVAKSEAAPVARVHVHPPTPPRSAFGNVLHAEAKEMNRANGVIGSALAQGLHPEAVKAVVEHRLHGHAREIASNVLAGATDAQGMAAKLADSQKVASALQAAASKAVNADHAEVIVASRLKGDAAVAGVSAVQALAGPAPSITVSEQQLAATAPLASPGAFDLPEIKVASQPEASTAATLAQQPAPDASAAPAPVAASEQPQIASAEAPQVVTHPVLTPESQPLPTTNLQQVATLDSGVVTFPVPTPETQPLSGPLGQAQALDATSADFASARDKALDVSSPSSNSAAQAMAESIAAGVGSAAKPDVIIEERSTAANAAGESIVAGAMGNVASSLSQGEPARAVLSDSVSTTAATGAGAMAQSLGSTSADFALAREKTLDVGVPSPNSVAQAMAESIAVGSAAASQAGAASNELSSVAVATGNGAMSAAAGEVLSATMRDLPDNSAKAPAIEERSTFASAASPSKSDVVIEDRSTRAAVEDAAAVSAKLESPATYSNLMGDKLRDAFSAATSLGDTVTNAVHGALSKGDEKPQAAAESVVLANSAAAGVSLRDVPIEERSSFAAADTTPKTNVAVEDRSTGASQADSAAVAAKMEANTSYSNVVGDKLRDAFSFATNMSETVSKAVEGGLAKGEEKLQSAADSVAQVIQGAASAGARVSLEDALTSHMQQKGFDSQSIAAASQIAQAIRDDMRSSQPQSDSMLVLHKAGAELASVVQAKDVPAVAQPGDSVLAMDTLEKVAAKGMDQNVIKELRGAMPEAVQNRSDLELAQSVGPTKSEMKGLDDAQNPQKEAQRQEKSAAAEQSREASAAMSMG